MFGITYDRSIRIPFLWGAMLFAVGYTACLDASEAINLKWSDINIGGQHNMRGELPFFPHRANSSTHGILTEHNFQNAEVCGACHTEIYQQWKGSMMAYSWDDPIYRALLKKASEATGGKIDYFCTGCHTPIGLTTGKINSHVNQQGPFTEEDIPIPGVDCEACHNISKRTGIDNGAYELSFGTNSRPLKYGPRKDAVSPFHDTQYSALHTRSDFCATCHNVTHPFNNVPIERTYDEWVESPYAKEGVNCQDCHMKPFRGKAALMGPERNDIASHNFTGANSTVLDHLGANAAAESARSMLRQSAQIEFCHLPEKLRPGELNRIGVKVMNSGAGHKLPTGFPEGREIWIDFSVKDRNGQVVYRLGRVENGRTEPDTKNFKVHLGDANGEEVDIEVWNVTHIISDNRILPKGYAVEYFDVILPEDSLGPYTLSAKLNYWPFPQALVDYLLGENKIKVDIVEITRATALVP